MTTTSKDFFAAIITAAIEHPEAFELQTSADVVDFCNRQIDRLNKRASTPRKPTPTQRENETIKANILAILAEKDHPCRISEILEDPRMVDKEGKSFTTNKVNSLLTQLKKEDMVNRLEGKTAFFTLRT